MTKRVITVTLNPCIDRSIKVDGLKLAELNRVVSKRYDLGGKGINLSTAIKGLGGKTKVLGFSYKESEGFIKSTLKARGIPFDLVSVKGALRENLKIFDTKTKQTTEVNEPGGLVMRSDITRMIEKTKIEAKKSFAVAFCGSVPQEVSKYIYQDLLWACENSKAFTVLDVEKELLTSGIKAKPNMIKPNLFELSTAARQKPKSHEEIVKAARDFALPHGVSYICVTMGSDGAMLITKDESYYSESPKIEVRSSTGAGDSFIAGFLNGLIQGKTNEELLAFGVAAASDSVTKEGTVLCDQEGFQKMLGKIVVRRID